MTEQAKDGKCVRRVNRGDERYPIFEPCGRDSVSIDANGKPVCRIHLAADQREQKRRREWSEKLDEGKALQARAEELSKALGVEVSAHYQALRHPGYTGKMVVPLEWLSEIARTGRVPPKGGPA